MNSLLLQPWLALVAFLLNPNRNSSIERELRFPVDHDLHSPWNPKCNFLNEWHLTLDLNRLSPRIKILIHY